MLLSEPILAVRRCESQTGGLALVKDAIRALHTRTPPRDDAQQGDARIRQHGGVPGHHHLSPQCIVHDDNLVDEVARSMASQAASRIRHLPADRSESTRMFPGSADIRNAYRTARVVRPLYLRDPTGTG